MRKQRKTKNEPTFDERIRQYISDDSVSLKEYELERTLCVNFPKRRRVPFLSLIALAILRWQGGILDMRFFNKK